MDGFYPGTFDPITRGHVNIIRRAARLFDRLVVGVVADANHKNPSLTSEQRAELVRLATQGISNVEVVVYEGEGMHNAIEMGCAMLVRGMRSGADFEYEHRYAQDFCEEQEYDGRRVETVFLATCEKHGQTSSTQVRNLIQTDGDWQYLVPLETHDKLAQWKEQFTSQA